MSSSSCQAWQASGQPQQGQRTRRKGVLGGYCRQMVPGPVPFFSSTPVSPRGPFSADTAATTPSCSAQCRNVAISMLPMALHAPYETHLTSTPSAPLSPSAPHGMPACLPTDVTKTARHAHPNAAHYSYRLHTGGAADADAPSAADGAHRGAGPDCGLQRHVRRRVVQPRNACRREVVWSPARQSTLTLRKAWQRRLDPGPGVGATANHLQ